jgi:VIT1/CCC1 family predicted Fe2+/Mn2+ transporter
MTTRSHKVETLRLNTAATEKLIKGIREVSVAAMYQAKVLAASDRSDSVQSSHVDAALKMVASKETTNWFREFAKIIGGALFGAFIPGLVAALTPANVTYVVVFVTAGFLGMILVFIGLRK